MEQIHSAFTKTITSLDEFEQLSNFIQSAINFATLREQLYIQILAKLNKAIQSSQPIADKF